MSQFHILEMHLGFDAAGEYRSEFKSEKNSNSSVLITGLKPDPSGRIHLLLNADRFDAGSYQFSLQNSSNSTVLSQQIEILKRQP